jgi:YkoY family integral membrane protein
MNLGNFPLLFMVVLWLVFLEGLLSADNALVLAMMVRHLPKAQQKRALRYGMWGAFLFRFVAVLLAKVLLEFWLLEVAGGGYLLYLAASHFLSRSGHDAAGADARRFGGGFWATVVSVELADIAFSIDSILAAVAMANGLPSHQVSPNEKVGIVVLGGILGIITMRFVAGYFIILLEKYRGLEPGAYALVAWIGLKLIAGGLYHARALPFEMNEWVFWIGMVVIVIMGLIYQPKTPPTPPDTREMIDEWLGGGGDGIDQPEASEKGAGGEGPGSTDSTGPDRNGEPGEDLPGGGPGQPPTADLPAHPG